MKRREFVKQSVWGAGALGTGLTLAANAQPSGNSDTSNLSFRGSTGKLLNAYYFRAHMYTLVPRHVREDLKWMADAGTDVVSIAILEQDLTAAVENVSIIQNEAAKEGMKVFVVPSRWGGLLAGAPKVPSHFSVTNPQTWLQKKDGTFYTDANVGVHSSVHYSETVDFFKRSLDTVFAQWEVAGIVWDEPKIYGLKDYSPQARAAISDIENVEVHNTAFSNFFSQLNAHIKQRYPQKITSLFIYANHKPGVMASAVRISDLDYFGCDGRPWGPNHQGKVEQEGKVLIGPGEKFMEAAQQNHKKSLFLIENHNMTADNNRLMDDHLGKVVAMQPDQLIYYYYPRNVDQPDENMAIIAKHIKRYK
jgi:hypothetical protein